jgi:hypothetical protein
MTSHLPRWGVVLICIFCIAFYIALSISNFTECQKLPDDYIVSINMGTGSIELKNGSIVELPSRFKNDFSSQPFKIFLDAMYQRNITTYSDLIKLDNLTYINDIRYIQPEVNRE